MKNLLKIQLNGNDLLYDVQVKTYLVAQGATSDSPETRSAIQVDDTETSDAQIRRSLDVAYAALCRSIPEYLMPGDYDVAGGGCIVVDGGTCSGDCGCNGDYIFSLHMPENFNRNMLSTAASAAHTYMVHSAVAEWFLLTRRQEAEVHASIANGAFKEFRTSLDERSRPTSRVIR